MSIKQSIDEVKLNICKLQDDVALLGQLIDTDNLKYLTRAERDNIFKRLFESMGVIEDTLKAVIKLAKPERRARIHDDDQLSRIIIDLAQMGVKVSSYEQPQQLDPSKCTMEAGAGVAAVTITETLAIANKSSPTYIEP